MSVEFNKLARKLSEKGFVDAANKTRAFRRDLEKDGLIPHNFGSVEYSPIPDLTYMISIQEETEVFEGDLGAQVSQLRKKKFGMPLSGFAELLGSNPSTISRIETGKYDPDSVTILRIAEMLRLGKKQAESMISGAGYDPSIVDIILRHQTT